MLSALILAGCTVSPPPAPQSTETTQTPPQNQVSPSSQIAERSRPDLTESLVTLRAAENEVRANARVVDTADEVLGTLIDTRA